MSEELKPEEREENSNSTTGEESEENFDDLFADGSEEENEEEKLTDLQKINKATGKDFKSMKDVAKSLSQLDKFFAKNGQKKEEKKEEESKPSMSKAFESIYFKSNPEAKEFWPKVEKIAKRMGRDPFEVYEDEDFSFLKTEAQALYEEKQEKEDSGSKVNKPSKKVTGSKSSNVELSDADRALLKRRGLKETDVKF